MDHDKIEKLTQELLIELGEDPQREGLIKTPERVARAWEYMSRGYRKNVKDVINGALFEENAHGMVIVRDIEFYSMCEHHLLPFFGVAHIGYIPDKKLLGISKIPRIVDMFSRRLQLQERLTQQIADTLFETLKPIGVGVVMEARHMCMQMRGVQKSQSITTTSAVLGDFHDDAETREEFLRMISKPV
ncbi:MAG: GTP cyclohydrolase I FolE [Candidatus Marinimicrobia bacterium]|jgi:GTP cyclohydrolase I|nr:GTP cyclohydrolase I FolE [Candidatus Neomarinimicrobiota bacterium]MDD5709408.1 GTP cyclohydrolase I FolE [Candidatus Neomarinimicrobiota bacterium]MDX9777286.1 GTP cyclohydrolase I FolE [bacterium]